MAFTYLKVKSAKYHCLLPVVLVLVLVVRIWSCLHRLLTYLFTYRPRYSSPVVM